MPRSLPVSFNNTCFTLIQIAYQGNDLDFDNVMKWYPLGQKEAISHTGLWRPWEEDNDHPNHKCGHFQSWSHDAFWAQLCAPMKIHPDSVWILKSFLREPPKNHHRSRKMAGMDGSWKPKWGFRKDPVRHLTFLVAEQAGWGWGWEHLASLL